jgi:hypothetical protein
MAGYNSRRYLSQLADHSDKRLHVRNVGRWSTCPVTIGGVDHRGNDQHVARRNIGWPSQAQRTSTIGVSPMAAFRDAVEFTGRHTRTHGAFLPVPGRQEVESTCIALPMLMPHFG